MYNAIQIFSLHFLIMVNCKQEKKMLDNGYFLKPS